MNIVFPNNINPFSLSKRINRPLILDGAMGSLLHQMGAMPFNIMWMSLLNITNPELVLKVHKKYIEAGADIITTNTFRTNPIAVEKYGKKLNCKELVKKSIDIAKNAVKELPIFIAGSNPPAEDSYLVIRKISNKKLEANHAKHIDLLIENGCHFVLNETQSHFDEIKIICKYCSKKDISYVISIFFDENLKLLSGEKIDAVFKYIIDYAPLTIGINCVKPATFLKYFKSGLFDYNWGYYLNCGSGNFKDKFIKTGYSPFRYLQVVKKSIGKSPSFVGACCGSTPEHIKKLKEYFDGKLKN
jgi:methionine synthase I (cobalamin-dependent)